MYQSKAPISTWASSRGFFVIRCTVTNAHERL